MAHLEKVASNSLHRSSLDIKSTIETEGTITDDDASAHSYEFQDFELEVHPWISIQGHDNKEESLVGMLDTGANRNVISGEALTILHNAFGFRPKRLITPRICVFANGTTVTLRRCIYLTWRLDGAGPAAPWTRQRFYVLEKPPGKSYNDFQLIIGRPGLGSLKKAGLFRLLL